MSPSMSHPVRRQVNTDPNSPNYCPWWYCDETAYIVKWAVIAAIFVIVIGFILGGYYHARRRMARGLPPLRYHRWLISRRDRERFFPPAPQNSHGFYRSTYAPAGHGQAQMYPMQNYGYAAPPPAYHEGESVPVYTPPSKVNPDQSYAVPPQGPPAAGSSSLNAPGPSQPPRAASPYSNNR